MTLRGTFLGPAGVEKVELVSLIVDHFNFSRRDARRLLDEGQVRIDGEVTYLAVIPVTEIEGRELQVGRDIVEIPA